MGKSSATSTSVTVGLAAGPPQRSPALPPRGEAMRYHGPDVSSTYECGGKPKPPVRHELGRLRTVTLGWALFHAQPDLLASKSC